MTQVTPMLSMPPTWAALASLMAVCLDAVPVGRGVARPDPVDIVSGPLFHAPHPGCYNATSLARKRRLRDDIAPQVAAGWVCAAFREALPGAEGLEPEAISDRTGGLRLDPTVLRAFVPDREIDRIVDAARAFESACIEAKRRGTSRAKGGKRAQTASASPSRVEEWLTRHRRIHDPHDASFIRERLDEVCERIGVMLDRGDVQALARIEPTAVHYLHVFEVPELRHRMSSAVAAAAQLPDAEVSPAVRAHALIEGRGMLLAYAGSHDELRDTVLTQDVWSGTLAEADRVAHAQSDAEGHRLVAISRTVFLRLSGLVEHRAGGDPEAAVRLLERARAMALDARHESLALSVAVDRAAVLRQEGREQPALATLLRAKALATHTGNARRLFRVLRESADLAHAMGNPLLAVAEAEHAEAVLDHLDYLGTLLLPTRLHGHWYQPSFRTELAELRERIAGSCRIAEALRGGPGAWGGGGDEADAGAWIVEAKAGRPPVAALEAVNFTSGGIVDAKGGWPPRAALEAVDGSSTGGIVDAKGGRPPAASTATCAPAAGGSLMGWLMDPPRVPGTAAEAAALEPVAGPRGSTAPGSVPSSSRGSRTGRSRP